MASEGLTCSICFERFDDQMFCPRLLRCGHSFCSSCLEKLLYRNAINCPTCRNAVPLPAGVAGLPKNFALLDILNTAPQHAGDGGLHFCEACDDKQHPATSCCLDCKEDMCKTAAGFHSRSKASRDHSIVSLEELKANPKLAAVSVLCPQHNARFRYFDEDCGHVVCMDCVMLEHSGHKRVSLDEAGSKWRQQMEALVTKAETHIEEIKAAEARVMGVRGDLRKAYNKDAAKIQGMLKELFATLTARGQFLMEQLVQQCKTKDNILTEQQNSLRTFQSCLQSVVQRAKSIQSSGNTEFLVSGSEIVSTLVAIESQPPVLEPQADCMLEFTVDRAFLLGELNNTAARSGRERGESAAATTGSPIIAPGGTLSQPVYQIPAPQVASVQSPAGMVPQQMVQQVSSPTGGGYVPMSQANQWANQYANGQTNMPVYGTGLASGMPQHSTSQQELFFMDPFPQIPGQPQAAGPHQAQVTSPAQFSQPGMYTPNANVPTSAASASVYSSPGGFYRLHSWIQ